MLLRDIRRWSYLEMSCQERGLKPPDSCQYLRNYLLICLCSDTVAEALSSSQAGMILYKTKILLVGAYNICTPMAEPGMEMY